MVTVRPAHQRKETKKAMANEVSRHQKRNPKNSPADNGASSLISPNATPKDELDNKLDEQLVEKPSGSHHDCGVEIAEASPVPSSQPPTPEPLRFTRNICACCSQGPESFTGEPGDESFKQLLKDRLLGLIFSHDAEMAGNIFATAAQNENRSRKRVWRETDLKLALADSGIYNVGLAMLEGRNKGLIEGGKSLVMRAKREVSGEISQKEKDRNDCAQSLLRLYNAMEEEERLEKEGEETTSASNTLMGLSATSTEDDDATLDGNETEIDERYQ